MRTIRHKSTSTTRSTLEARWAVFFRELNLKWKYEPHLLSFDRCKYLPDFYVDEFGYIEIKPTLDLFIEESASRIAKISIGNPDIKIYAFCSDRVEFGDVAMYHGGNIFAPTTIQIYGLLSRARPNRFGTLEAQDIDIKRAMQIANTTRFNEWANTKDLVLEVIEGLAKP